jgi:hypothetical protein
VAKIFRFELKYFRIIKKIFKRRFIRTKAYYFRPFLWVYLYPNLLLTMKGKNSRMGVGVGSPLRVCSLLYPGTKLVSCKRFHNDFLQTVSSYITKKLPIFTIAPR